MLPLFAPVVFPSCASHMQQRFWIFLILLVVKGAITLFEILASVRTNLKNLSKLLAIKDNIN